MKRLLIIAIVAFLAVQAMAKATPIQLASGACPVNLKLLPTATITAPAFIDVAITKISSSGMGSSSGSDSGQFLIGTNLAMVQISASILTPGLSGGTWGCMLQGNPNGDILGSLPPTDTSDYPGPIPTGTPFNVFVQVTGVNMTAMVWSPNFIYDTTLTLTISTI
jgi:hypothetical protein